MGLAVFVPEGSSLPPQKIPAAMKRFILSASIAACSVLVWTATASGAKPNKKQQQQPTPAPSALPSKPAAPESKPMNEELPSPWRTWSDPAGRTIEAAFASLYGNIVTIQTKEGQTYQINLMNLVPADRAFANDYAQKLRKRSFANDYVKKAAYQIDYLIGSTLVARRSSLCGAFTSTRSAASRLRRRRPPFSPTRRRTSARS
jgi:glucose/arabinose dehydrogenase